MSNNSISLHLRYLSPLLIPFFLFFVGGIALAVLQSLGMGLPFPYEGGLLDSYKALMTPYMLRSFLLSIKVGGLAALFSVAIGTLLAVGLWRMPSLLQQAGIIYKIPLILPHLAVGFIVFFFWAKSGLISSAMFHAGLTKTPQDFPSILFGGDGWGMIIAYTYKQIPFALLMVYASLKRLDMRLLETAYMLGAGHFRAFRTVTYPHISSTLHSTFCILFLVGFGAFEIPFLLGGSQPAMLSIEAYNMYFRKELYHRPQAMAILIGIFLFSTVFLTLYLRSVAPKRPEKIND
ncbi:ABC transporter permease [Halodesulfovibrio marinisediminis]|uniref:Putative spermidine/putrescine transport system permease protein n=1 Tax=Halodesulfovibrio marinisediminis DSM 17456 TaxID=1121457 RepID=A0A1N6J5J1_9BACT|nr:ABC transporter permease subunit [Halodesulfovibrio marinisediminis]SIO39515.1 putative spermidine/putrescine transport system permease protein [Halodesulfovibrio marinisediminis DSM 17456]